MLTCLISFPPYNNLCVGTVNIPIFTNGKTQAQNILLIFPQIITLINCKDKLHIPSVFGCNCIG